MKKFKTAIWMASAALFTIAANTAAAQTIERPTLTADQCQPLSAENVEICCIASNRVQLLTAAELDQCPPLTTARIRAVTDDSANSVILPGTTVVTVPVDGTDQPGEEPGGEPGGEPGEEPGGEPGDDTANTNSGAGNAGETGSGEHASTDADPGNSGENNNSPDSPGGQN